MVVISINPDIDAVSVALVGLGGRVHARVRHVTPRSLSASEMTLAVSEIVPDLVTEVDGQIRVVAAGVAVPGIVRVRDGMVAFAPHLEWVDEPLARLMEEKLSVPTYVANDANVGTVAERLYGRARERDDVIYLNGSRSGIGGGVIVGGRLLTGSRGFGAELGHTSTTGVVACYCGRIGCLETEVNLARLLGAMGVASVDPDELGRVVGEAADGGVRREVDRQLDVLAVSVADYISVFNPEMVVLAGFLGELFEMNSSRLREAVSSNSFRNVSEGVEIVRADLRSEHLLIGAAELALSTLLENPMSVSLEPSVTFREG